MTIFILKDSASDIKFAPKSADLLLAVAVANGTIKIFKREDPGNLTSFSEYREINLMKDLGECTCLTWNSAFDEPTSLIVGCHMTSPSQYIEQKEEETNQKQEMQLLQMIILRENKDDD